MRSSWYEDDDGQNRRVPRRGASRMSLKRSAAQAADMSQLVVEAGAASQTGGPARGHLPRRPAGSLIVMKRTTLARTLWDGSAAPRLCRAYTGRRPLRPAGWRCRFSGTACAGAALGGGPEPLALVRTRSPRGCAQPVRPPQPDDAATDLPRRYGPRAAGRASRPDSLGGIRASNVRVAEQRATEGAATVRAQGGGPQTARRSEVVLYRLDRYGVANCVQIAVKPVRPRGARLPVL